MRSFIQGVVLFLLVVGGSRYLSSHFTPSGLLAQADELSSTEGCAAAMPLYDRAIEFGAGFDGYSRRATCRVKLKQYDVALSDWQDAADAEANSPAPHLARASLFRRLDRPDQALQEYNRAVLLDPGAEIHLLRADFLFGTGNLDQAATAYKELMTRTDAPNAASRASFKYAEIQLAKGDGAGAIATADQGLQQWPDDALGLYDRGIFRLAVEGRANDAAADLARSIEAGAKYRMASIILDAGIAVLENKRVDRSSDYSFSEPYLPMAINAILLLDIARSRAGQDGSNELRKNFDDIEFALRPTGALQPARLTGWPTPIVKYYLKEIDLNELMVRAEHATGTFSTPPICTANLFASIHPETGVNPEEVQRRLRLSAEKCPAASIEHSLAVAGLGRSIQ